MKFNNILMSLVLVLGGVFSLTSSAQDSVKPVLNFEGWTQNYTLLNNGSLLSDKINLFFNKFHFKLTGEGDNDSGDSSNVPPIDPDQITVDFVKINGLFTQVSQEALLNMPGVAKKINFGFSQSSSFENKMVNFQTSLVLAPTEKFPKDTAIQASVGLSSNQALSKISLLGGLTFKIDVVKFINKILAGSLQTACSPDSPSASALALLCPFFPAKSTDDLWNAVVTVHNVTLASLTLNIFNNKKQIKALEQKEYEEDDDIFEKEKLQLQLSSLSMLRDLLLQVRFDKKNNSADQVESFSVGVKKVKVGPIIVIDQMEFFVAKGQLLKTKLKASIALPPEVTQKIWDVIKISLYTIQNSEQVVLDAGKVYIKMFVGMLAGLLR